MPTAPPFKVCVRNLPFESVQGDFNYIFSGLTVTETKEKEREGERAKEKREKKRRKEGEGEGGRS